MGMVRYHMIMGNQYMKGSGLMMCATEKGIKLQKKGNIQEILLSIFSDIMIKSDQFNGAGVYCEADGTVYDGDWVNGQKNGMAHVKFSNGDTYVGEYKFNKKHGKGQYTYANGEIYSGEFMNDMKHGTGHLIKSGGVVIAGKFG